MKEPSLKEKKALERDIKKRIAVFTQQLKAAAEEKGIQIDVLVHIKEVPLTKEG